MVAASLARAAAFASAGSVVGMPLRSSQVARRRIDRAAADAVIGRVRGAESLEAVADAESSRVQSFPLTWTVKAVRVTEHERASSPNVVGVLRGGDEPPSQVAVADPDAAAGADDDEVVVSHGATPLRSEVASRAPGAPAGSS